MKRYLKKILLFIFHSFPEKLDARMLFVLIVSLPLIIYKAVRRKKISGVNTVNLNIEASFKPDPLPVGMENEDICIRFSGGTDSMLAAARYAACFKKVHLLTFDIGAGMNPFGIIPSDPKNASYALELLSHKFGVEKFVINYGEIQDIRNSIYFRDFLSETGRDNFMSVTFCTSCALAMHIKTIIYCAVHGIKYAADGSNIENGMLPYQTQHLSNLIELKQLYLDFGIKFLVNPDYFSADAAVILKKEGIYSEGTDRNDYHFRRKTQQFCVLIQFQSICRMLQGKTMDKLPDVNIKTLITANRAKYREYVESVTGLKGSSSNRGKSTWMNRLV